MSADQKSNTEFIEFNAVINRASPYTPGKILDTISDVGGDTLLSLESAIRSDMGDLTVAEKDLRQYLIERGDDGEIGNQAYSEIVRKRLLEIALVRAALAQVTAEDDKSAEIREIQKSLYDYYSPTLFQAALRKKIEILEATQVPSDLEMSKAALLDELDSYAAIDESDDMSTLEQPTPETLRAIGDWLHSQFEDVFDEIDGINGDELDACQLTSVMKLAIATTPVLRNNEWRAETIKRNKLAVSVFASDRRVVIPEQRRVSKLTAKRLVIHEVFGHALRSGIAETNGDEIGMTGTATYGEFEESLGIALEQCLQGKYDSGRGIDHYISVGFAETLGLPRDKIAQLIRSMRQLTIANRGLTKEKIEQANTFTENQIRRTFAGFTDIDDGIAHRADIKYLHGLNGTWKLLNAITEADQVDEGMRWLLSAKFNPYSITDQQLMRRFSDMPSSIKGSLAV